MSIIDELGLDPESLSWRDLAACKNIVQVFYVDEHGYVVGPGEGVRKVYDPMYDSYEEDEPPYVTRKATDGMCLSCPVQKICYEEGKSNKESGVWGGVYLTNGRIDRTRNEHKTREDWKVLKEELDGL